MEEGWVKSLSPEEMPTLLISASFAVNPHFSSSDGLEWQFSREARVDNATAWEANLRGWQLVR